MSSSTNSFISLKPTSEWKTAKTQNGLVSAFEKRLKEEVPGVAFTFSQPIQMRMQDLLQGARGDVVVSIYGDDLSVLRQKAEEVAGAISNVQGAADTKPEALAGYPSLIIKVNRVAVARYGMNVSDVLNVVESIGGHTASTVYGRNNSQTEIVFRLPPNDRTNVEEIRNLPVSNAQGRMIPLSELADVAFTTGPAEINRQKLQRRITVMTNIRGRDAGSFVEAAQAAVNKQVKLPPRYSMEWGGQFQNLQQATARLSIVVPVTLAIIFMLLYLLFDSVLIALLIFLNVPIAATGGIAALTLRGLPFSISAAIGFIATFGIAILNGVVLMSYVLSEQGQGLDPKKAAREAALIRLRPVLTTALVASLGFVPMAVSTGAGAEVQRPLATVVIGGLIVATLLTLVLLPSVYPLAHKWSFRARKAINRASGVQPAE